MDFWEVSKRIFCDIFGLASIGDAIDSDGNGHFCLIECLFTDFAENFRLELGQPIHTLSLHSFFIPT